MAENLVDAQALAKFFKKSVRRIEQLKSEGVIKGKGRPTKYDLFPTIQAYIEYLENKAYGREKKQTDAQLETDRLASDARIKKAKAEMAELELKEIRGQMHRAADVEAITTDHVMYIRSMLMALPGKLAVDMARINAAPEAAERIKQEVFFILNRLTEYEYDPEEYKKRVLERRGLSIERQEDDGDADDE